MAVVVDPKNNPTPPEEKHSSFFNLGVRLEKYLLSSTPRAKGQWVRRNGGNGSNPYEDKMHLLTMLRFYRYCKFLTTKEYQYQDVGRPGTIRMGSRSPATHWYAHNCSLSLKLQIVEEDYGDVKVTSSRLLPMEPDGQSVFLIPREVMPATTVAETYATSTILIADPPNEDITIKMDAEMHRRMRLFLEWVRNDCPEPTDKIAGDPLLTRKYDQTIWNKIFECLGHEEWAR